MNNTRMCQRQKMYTSAVRLSDVSKNVNALIVEKRQITTTKASTIFVFGQTDERHWPFTRACSDVRSASRRDKRESPQFDAKCVTHEHLTQIVATPKIVSDECNIFVNDDIPCMNPIFSPVVSNNAVRAIDVLVASKMRRDLMP